MELKVGREYLDAFHNFKYKVLGTRNDRVYVVDDGELHDLSFFLAVSQMNYYHQA